MTLSQLALTVLLLGGLGLVASRSGSRRSRPTCSPACCSARTSRHVPSLISPSEVTDFVAELGIVFLLFFLGLEFSLGRLVRSGRHVGVGGAVDLLVNAAFGLAVGVGRLRPRASPRCILAAAIYVSSSAITVKGLIDFRRLADDETDLVLAILVFEDLVIAFVLGFAAPAAVRSSDTLLLVVKAIAFIALSLAASRWLARPIDRLLDRLPREFFLLVDRRASWSAWPRSPRSSACRRRSAR